MKIDRCGYLIIFFLSKNHYFVTLFIILWHLKKKWLSHPTGYRSAYTPHTPCVYAYMMHIYTKDDRTLQCRDNDIHTPCRNTITYINLPSKGVVVLGDIWKTIFVRKSPAAQMYPTTPPEAGYSFVESPLSPTPQLSRE